MRIEGRRQAKSVLVGLHASDHVKHPQYFRPESTRLISVHHAKLHTWPSAE